MNENENNIYKYNYIIWIEEEGNGWIFLYNILYIINIIFNEYWITIFELWLIIIIIIINITRIWINQLHIWNMEIIYIYWIYWINIYITILIIINFD